MTVMTEDYLCQTIQKMQANGEKISVRTLRSHTGGSFSTVAPFLKRWQEEQARAQSRADHAFSPNLRQAILVEISKAVTDTTALFTKQLDQAKEGLEEAHAALIQQESESEASIEKIEALTQQIAVTEALQNQQREKVEALEKKIDIAVQAQHEADKRAAIAETRYTELTTRYEQLNEQYKQTQQETAAAKKEIEMLREQAKAKDKPE